MCIQRFSVTKCDVRDCANNVRLVYMHPNIWIIVSAASLPVKDALLGSVATEIVRLPARLDVSHQNYRLTQEFVWVAPLVGLETWV